jgi:hypothetical protein
MSHYLRLRHLTCENKINTQSVANKSGDINSNPNKHRGKGFLGIEFCRHSLCKFLLDLDKCRANESHKRAFECAIEHLHPTKVLEQTAN